MFLRKTHMSLFATVFRHCLLAHSLSFMAIEAARLKCKDNKELSDHFHTVEVAYRHLVKRVGGWHSLEIDVDNAQAWVRGVSFHVFRGAGRYDFVTIRASPWREGAVQYTISWHNNIHVPNIDGQTPEDGVVEFLSGKSARPPT